MGSLITELKRRKVFRVAGVYGIVAWVVIQVADTVLPALQMPSWTVSFFTILFILGFPIALVLAWAYEITPSGIQSDGAANLDENRQATPAPQNQWLIYATFALVLLVAGFQIADRFFGLGAKTPAVSSINNPSISDASISSSPLSNTRIERVTRLAVAIPEDEFFDIERGDFTLSADGNMFVYRGADEDGNPILWRRRMDELSGKPIPNTEFASRPRISPDSTEVLFSGNRGIGVASLRGGLPRTLVETGADGADWSPDGAWVYYRSAEGDIRRIPSLGGQDEEIVTLNKDAGEEGFLFTEVLPGNNLIYTVVRADGEALLQTFNAETEQKKNLTVGTAPIYVASGHLLFQIQDTATLMAAPFDTQTLELSGPALPLAEGLLQVGAGVAGNIGVSSSGRLIYRTGDVAGRLATPMWVDRSGVGESVIEGWDIETIGEYGIPALSPDGSQIAVSIGSFAENKSEVWITKLDGIMSRITFGDRAALAPTWTPDGQSIIYNSWDAQDIYSYWKKRVDGSGIAEKILETEFSNSTGFLSDDGEWLIYRDDPKGIGSGRILGVKTSEGYEPKVLIETKFEVTSPALSPDGRWLAYASIESGQWEIYVQPFPALERGRWQVSRGGGTGPMWGNSGKELFYVNGNNEFAGVELDTTTATTFSWGVENVLFVADDYRTGSQAKFYDIDLDDQRFLMMGYREVSNTQLIMVDNWMGDLKTSP